MRIRFHVLGNAHCTTYKRHPFHKLKILENKIFISKWIHTKKMKKEQ